MGEPPKIILEAAFSSDASSSSLGSSYVEWAALIVFLGIIGICAVLMFARPRDVFCSNDFEAMMDAADAKKKKKPSKVR